MKFIEGTVKSKKSKYYVDIDKAFKIAVEFSKVKDCFIAKAYFLTSQNANPNNYHYPIFVELKKFNKEIDAVKYIEKLLGNFLEKEE